jgi:hypothetical protein
MIDTIQNQFEQIEKSARVRESSEYGKGKLRISSALPEQPAQPSAGPINPHFQFKPLTFSKTRNGGRRGNSALWSPPPIICAKPGKFHKAVTLGDSSRISRNMCISRNAASASACSLSLKQNRHAPRSRCLHDPAAACRKFDIPRLGPLMAGAITIRAFREGALNCLEVEDNGVDPAGYPGKNTRPIEESGDEFWSQNTGLRTGISA